MGNGICAICRSRGLKYSPLGPCHKCKDNPDLSSQFEPDYKLIRLMIVKDEQETIEEAAKRRINVKAMMEKRGCFGNSLGQKLEDCPECAVKDECHRAY